MTIEKNDPRLTAFVLGELSEDETKEVQAALYADTELQTEVEAIRKTVAEIEDFMKNEPVPGETKVSTPGTIDKPEKAEEIKKRRFPLTIVELLVVVSIIGMLAGLLLPAKQAAREAGRNVREMNSRIAAQNRAEQEYPAAVPTSEAAPVDDLRYFDKDESAEKSDRLGRPGKVAQLGRPLQEPPASPPVTIGLTTPGDVSADLSIPAEQSMYGFSDPAFGGFMVGKVPATHRREVPGRPRNDVRGLRSAPSSAPEESAGKPMEYVDPERWLLLSERQKKDTSAKDKDGRSITMMVTPRVIVQEEEEEYLTGLRDAEGKPVQLGRPVQKPLESALPDPYNSANDEAYKNFVENDFLRPQKAPFSTFSIDVDTAAYTTMRRYINQGQRPPAASVRLEEYVNFFKYDYAQPTDGQLSRGEAFATHVDVAPCPWEPKHLLARIGIKGKEYTVDERPPLNLVFLIDTSGSMESSNRLPLVQRGLTELVEMLQPKDRVAIVTYAGSSKLALPSVSGQEKRAILDSINSLNAGGSTAGAQGIKTAYETARKYYNKNAQNRVILCTDGDFNVGTTDNSQLERIIGEEAKSGVFLTILGFGMGNYKDERLKTLSMRGNGNYGYIDTIEEARRLLVEGLTGTLFAIAKDVKIQVDFNPARVAAYRLLGYENRKLRDEDFHNDKIDAGEIGAGHTVTALYEIVPFGGTVPSKVDESRYAEKPGSSADAAHPAREETAHAGELMFVKLRYKQPDGDKSSLLEYPVVYEKDATLSGDAEFAAGVALYGMLLRLSRYSGAGTFDAVLELAEPNVKDDPYRKEFVELVRKAKELR